MKKNNSFSDCELPCEEGNNEKCSKCDTNNNTCSACNEGYYLPEDDEEKKQCKKCSDENCAKCVGTKNNNICISCKSNYFLNPSSKCELLCQLNEGCLECDNQLNECLKCKNRYYFPEDVKTRKKCLSCPYYCETCEGTVNDENV